MPQPVGRMSLYINGEHKGTVDQVIVTEGKTHLIELKTEKLRQMGMAFSHAAYIFGMFPRLYSNPATRYHKRLLRQWRNSHAQHRR